MRKTMRKIMIKPILLLLVMVAFFQVNGQNLSSKNEIQSTINKSIVDTCTPVLISDLNGPSMACRGGSGYVYTVEIANATYYTWNIPIGGTITSGLNTNSITVNYSMDAQSGFVSVIGGSDCSVAIISASKPVQLHDSPATNPTILGTNELCVNSTGTYTTESLPVGWTYVWDVSNGGSITSGHGNDTVVITYSTSGTKTVLVTTYNTWGCPSLNPGTFEVVVDPLPITTVNGPITACTNYPVTYTTQSDMTNYEWIVSPDDSILSGQGTNSVIVEWGSVGSHWIKVNYTNINGCTSTNPTVLDVNVSLGAYPSVIGYPTACLNSDFNQYTTDPNMTDYVWEISEPTVNNYYIDPYTPNVILVAWNTLGEQWVKVNYTNINSCTADEPTKFNVTVNPIPSTPVVTMIGDTLYSNSPIGNQWYLNDVAIVGATDSTYVVTESGQYYVITTIDGCSSVTSDTIQIVMVGVENLNTNSVSLYPNPNNGHFTLTVASPSKETFVISIFNSLGIKIYESHDTVNGTLNKNINLNVSQGIYSIVLQNGNVHLEKKIVINK